MFPTNSELLEKSKKTLSKRIVLKILLAVVVIQISQILISTILSTISDGSFFLNVLTIVITSHVQASFTIGLISFYMSIARGNDVKIDLIFSYFNSIKPLLASLLYVIMFLVGFVFFIVPGILIALTFFPVFYMIADDKQIDFFEAFNKSYKLMFGRKGQLFFLQLRAFLFVLLAFIPCFLAFIIGINSYTEEGVFPFFDFPGVIFYSIAITITLISVVWITILYSLTYANFYDALIKKP